MTHDTPDPAYTFAFIVQERFDLHSGLTVVSEPHCKCEIPGLKTQALLRTPAGAILETAASYVFCSPNLNGIISLSLSGLTKEDVPIGTELFVRLRRTPEELSKALALFDEMMGKSWTTVKEFANFPDAQDFKVWIKHKMADGLAEEVTIKKPYRRNLSGEHWYKNTETQEVWRYLETNYPRNESFTLIDNYSTDTMHVTLESMESDDHSNFPPIKVWINDRLPFESDYTLDVNSFFQALGEKHSSVSFIGGCGIAMCCAVGFRTTTTDSGWQWSDFNFTWQNVYEVAGKLINFLEKPLVKNEENNSILDECRRKRDTIKSLYLSDQF